MKVFKPYLKVMVLLSLLAIGFGLLGQACGRGEKEGTPVTGATAQDIARARGLSDEDIVRALKQFVPPGKYDEYLLFASGGHGGQVLVIGVPSMRILKVIGVFTPEPWQGLGYGADWGDTVLEQGNPNIPENVRLSWGDVHHPALSETNGEYDGRWLYVNDRANGRVAMVDLRDFRVKQIVAIPNMQTNHGGAFVTPNTEYIVVTSKYPTPWPEGSFAELSEYAEKFRGVASFLKVHPETGRIVLEESFQVELPPYNQDLADAGKKVSDGWAFFNSFNTELATGGVLEGKPPLEAGMSQNAFDYLHIINGRKAQEVVAAGKYEMLNGMRVIRLPTAIQEGILFFAPEPKSPHGVDVDPSGRYIVVGGKLDPHVTIYDFKKIEEAIRNRNFEGTDRYGVPILKFDAVVAAQVEVGAGPLHTQFDDQGHGYTSLFIESAVAKFTLGPGVVKTGEPPFTLVDKINVHYNIGHLVAAEGDTVSPDSNYLVALNKWSIDRFLTVGPLHPQNFQLIDLKGGRGPMELIADMPIPIGEPHYSQMIKADKVKAWEVYPVGTNALTMKPDPNAVKQGQERIERRGNTVEVWMTAVRSHFRPDQIRVRQGDKVILHITNPEQTRDATHGFAIADYNIQVSIEPGETTTIEFVADKPGVFNFYCTEFCSALHLEMAGWLLVEPAKVAGR
jgi:nitrous-oxide reductase